MVLLALPLVLVGFLIFSIEFTFYLIGNDGWVGRKDLWLAWLYDSNNNVQFGGDNIIPAVSADGVRGRMCF